MGHYLSAKFREKIVGILVSGRLIEDLKEEEAKHKELFGPQAWSWLKQANTLITKALHDGLSRNIDDDQKRKIHEAASKYKIILMRPSEPLPPDHTNLETKKLYDLAEMAISKQCVGCTIENFKGCRLYEVLNAADMPGACEEKEKCPYLQ